MITEAEAVMLITLLVALIVMLFTVANLILRMKRDNRQHHLMLKVIVDNLIEIVAKKYYGKEEETGNDGS